MALGSHNPRLSEQGEMEICLRFQNQCYTNQDPPPNSVKPIILQVLHHTSILSVASTDPEIQGTCNIIILEYLYLLYPGRYTTSKSEITPFRLCDTTLPCDNSTFTQTSNTSDLQTSTFAILDFTTHNDGVCGKKIDHGASGYPLTFPKEALCCCIL